jgi:hypothetical protein
MSDTLVMPDPRLMLVLYKSQLEAVILEKSPVAQEAVKEHPELLEKYVGTLCKTKVSKLDQEASG